MNAFHREVCKPCVSDLGDKEDRQDDLDSRSTLAYTCFVSKPLNLNLFGSEVGAFVAGLLERYGFRGAYVDALKSGLVLNRRLWEIWQKEYEGTRELNFELELDQYRYRTSGPVRG